MKALTDKIIDDLMDEKKEHRGGLMMVVTMENVNRVI